MVNSPRRAAQRTAALLGVIALCAAPARSAWRLEEARSLTRSGEALAPVLSVDGKRLAYLVGSRRATASGEEAVSGRVWAMDIAARSAGLLGRFPISLPSGEPVAAFSPRGSAYATVEGGVPAPNLWYVDDDGSRLRVGGGRAMAFHPDGSFLAYQVLDLETEAALELWLFDVERRESKRLARVVVSRAPSALMPPRWTPDAARILFLADGDIFAYGRYTGRIEPLTRTGDVTGMDIARDGALWYSRAARDRDAAGLWRQRADGKTSMRAFRADELPAGIAGLTAGPDPDAVLFLADTALGRGLVAADVRDGRWRFLADALSFDLRPGGLEVALESPSGEGRRNIVLARLAWDGATK